MHKQQFFIKTKISLFVNKNDISCHFLKVEKWQILKNDKEFKKKVINSQNLPSFYFLLVDVAGYIIMYL